MTIRPPFGRPMRTHFPFPPTHTPLNHGSFGAYPNTIQTTQSHYQNQCNARPSTFYVYDLPPLIDASRAAIAPLLGADVEEVVLIPNATTGTNTVLRNLRWEEGDAIIYFSTIYDALEKTVESVREMAGAEIGVHVIELRFPIGEEVVLERFRRTVVEGRQRGVRFKMAIFDTILTFPGVRLPWEELVYLCKDLGILSLIDGAHGIGHIDLTHLGSISPDFFVSNCHKWLYTPRSCAVFFVPLRNQHLIRTTLPTSHGYRPSSENDTLEEINTYFLSLFNFVATIDYSPYLCIPAALSFRNSICGSEAAIQKYCYDLAKQGGEICAEILGTDTLPIAEGRETSFANIRLPIPFSNSSPITSSAITESNPTPLSLSPSPSPITTPLSLTSTPTPTPFPPSLAPKIQTWLNKTAVQEFDTYLQVGYHADALWVRISAQIYLEAGDFKWAAGVLKGLCERVCRGEWRGVEGSGDEW